MKHLIIPTVNVFIISDSKLMLSRRANTGWMDGSLCPPGGHIEAGETPTVAMLLKIKEELGVTVKPEDLEFACVVVRNTPATETVAFEFVVRDKAYTYKNNEPDKCSELIWVDMNDLPNDIIDQFREVLLQGIINKTQYLEIGY
jgi:8-oxo-dGTP diphosphatase